MYSFKNGIALYKFTKILDKTLKGFFLKSFQCKKKIHSNTVSGIYNIRFLPAI